MPAQTNLALIVDTNPFSRTIQDRGVPTAGSEELLIRVEAAGLNPVDARIGKMQIPMWADMPTVPGAEASGVIVAIGSEVKGFKVGDRVCVASIVATSIFSSLTYLFAVPSERPARNWTYHHISSTVLHTQPLSQR
jgi:NADPH:quinone reductase-like Zn-dependent oxidoreductase